MILDTIAEATRKRVETIKGTVAFSEIKKKALEIPKGDFRFEGTLKSPDISFICEIKKASPSKGVIAKDFPYLEIAKDYEEAGAAAISVLTEPDFFQGSNSYLKQISEKVSIPILRKDFTIDEYQIYEAKTIGADAILLICTLLDTKTLCRYIEICNSLGISALVEAHSNGEVKSALAAGARIIGVNNRDLRTFDVDISTSIHLRSLVPPEVIFIAESGIKSSEDVRLLRQAGVDGVLIGETLMRATDKKSELNKLGGVE